MALKLKTSIDLYSNGKLQTGSERFVTITKKMIYISRDKTRSYWLLEKKVPKISFNDTKMTMRIATNKVVFNKPAEYNKAKAMLKNL